MPTRHRRQPARHAAQRSGAGWRVLARLQCAPGEVERLAAATSRHRIQREPLIALNEHDVERRVARLHRRAGDLRRLQVGAARRREVSRRLKGITEVLVEERQVNLWRHVAGTRPGGLLEDANRFLLDGALRDVIAVVHHRLDTAEDDAVIQRRSMIGRIRLIHALPDRGRLTIGAKRASAITEVLEAWIAEHVGDMPVGQHQIAIP